MCRFSKTFAAVVLCLALAGSSLAEQESRVVYESDNRLDENKLTVATDYMRAPGQSTVAFIQKSSMSISGGKYIIKTTQTLQQYGVCPEQRFSQQIIPAYCSGFLIAENMVATAGHCIKSRDSCDEAYIVFGFKMNTDTEVAKTFESSQVFTCKSFRAVYDGYVDFSIVTLDRVATGFEPLELDATSPNLLASIFVVGHPTGLPRKYADDAVIRVTKTTNSLLRWFFITNLDTFAGNSGSGVFYRDSKKVAGILVRGSTDYLMDSDRNCLVVNKCDKFSESDQNCGGEHVIVSEAIVPYVPLECTVGSDCKNKGLCQSGTCQCQPGYYGNDCSFQCGRDKCYDHGECVGLWECKCDAGYGGDLCYSSGITVGTRPAMLALSALGAAVLYVLSF